MKRKMFAVVSAALASTALLAACGSSSSSGGSDKALTKVTIVRSTESLSMGPLFVAAGAGYFKDAGLDVEFVTTRGDADAQSALDSGSAQFVVSTVLNQLKAIQQGRPFTVMTAIGYQNNAYVLSAQQAKKLGYKESMTIEQRAQLFKGLKVGVGTVGGASDLILRAIFKQNGLTPGKDVDIVALGTTALTPALKAGQIDGGLMGFPDIAQAAKDDSAVPALPAYGTMIPWLAKSTNMGMSTTTDYAAKHPEVVKAMQGAMDKALKLIQSDPTKAGKVTKQYFATIDEDVWTTTWKQIPVTYPKEAGFTEEQFKNVITMADNIDDKSLDNLAYSKAVWKG